MWKVFLILGLGIKLTNSIGPINEVSVTNLQSVENRQNELTYRLPTNVRPLKYILDIIVDVDNDVFSGNVIINLEVITSTTSIHLNYKELGVDWRNARLTLDSSIQTFQVTNQVDRPVEQIYELHFEPVIDVGTYNLELQFEGNIRNDLTGLYKSSYIFTNETLSETRYLAATHLEPTYARSIFPCFDEPAFKAKFSVSIGHVQKYRIMSNMPAQGEPQLVPGMVNFYKTTFPETTVNMSTYLLAFVIAEDYESYTEDPRLLRVVASAHDIHSVVFAQNFGARSLEWYERWLNKDYQLPKLDMVNIPDFLFGAMENWGLIFFRNPYLLRDESDIFAIPVRTQQSGALLISHELAHMWFGNELTPEFWTYIWLSEGFARFFEYYTTDALLPSWNLMHQFLVTNFQSALSQDDKISARAMTTDVVQPDVINNMFDYIVYAKSACIIRMFQHVIGMDAFQAALRSYIQERSYSTTNPDHLFTHFQNAIISTGLNLPGTIKNLFETWSNHAGYPLIKATRNIETRTILFEQSRFFVDPFEAQGRSFPERSIPINIATSSNRNFEDTRPDLWILPNSSLQSRTAAGPDNDNWVIVNKQLTGYYRVQYDQHNYDLLISEVNSDNSNIHVLNRAQLIDDAINLAKARFLNIKTALGFLNSLNREKDLPEAYSPWATGHNALTYLNGYLKGHKHYDLFESFVANISSEPYTNVRVNNVETRHLHRIHRLSVARWACLTGVQVCLDDVDAIIDGMINGTFQIIDEIKDFVYCSAVKYSDRLTVSLGTQLVTLLRTTGKRNDEEINRIISGLACSTNEAYIRSSLDLWINISIPSAPMTREDLLYLFRAVAGASAMGMNSALHFLANNFLDARERFGAENLAGLFRYLGPLINSQNQINYINEITSNFSSSLTSEQHEAAVTAMNRARENIEWLTYHEESISEWLLERVAVDPSSASAVILNASLLVFALSSLRSLFI